MYLPEKEHLYLLGDVVYNRMVQGGRMYFCFCCLLRCRKIDCELGCLGRTIMMHGEEGRWNKAMNEFTPEDAEGIHMYSKI